jgi:hypothetical protein
MPDSRRADMYDRLFELFQGTYPALRDTMHRLVDMPWSSNDSGGHGE